MSCLPPVLRAVGALWVALSSMLPAAAQTTSPALQIGTPAFEAYVDGVARGQMQALGVPGLALAVVDRAGNTLVKAWGVGSDAGGNPVAVDAQRAVLPMASISKTFIGIALTRAVERGLLALDDPVNKHLDFTIPTWPGGRPITLRDLTRHEAGFEERWLATGSGGGHPDPRPWPQILASTFPLLIAPPGDYASYSNYGATLLAYVVQRVAAQPYEEFLQREVLVPLGLSSTGLADPLPPDLAARQLGGWESSNGVPRAPQRSFNVRSAPSGRMHTTLPDMVQLMRFLMGDGSLPDAHAARFLKPESMRAMLEPTKRLAPTLPGIATLFAEKDIAGMRFVGHGGDGNSHHTDLIVSREQGLGLYVVFLSAPGPHARDNLTRAVLQGLRTSPPAMPMGTPMPPPDLSRLAGSYRTYRWAETSIERVLQLSSEFAIRATSRGTLIVTGRLGQGEWVPVPAEEAGGSQGVFRHRLNGDLMRMWADAQGRPRFTSGNYPFVTAYKLDDVDTQSFNTVAYWTLVTGLGAAAVSLLLATARSWRHGRSGSAVGTALLAAATAASSWALYYFVAKALSMSEPEVQMAIPGIARWVLAVPPAACALVLIWLVGAAQGRLRPAGRGAWMATLPSLVVFAAFVVYVAHWNGLGWNFP